MKTRFFLILYSLFTLGIATGRAQNLTQQLTNYRQQIPQEKLFFHLDRPLYLVGETIWFKTHCVDAALHTPMNMSKVAYLEVLDKDQNPVLQTKITLNGGKGTGSVFIPPFLASGNYFVRGYTQWMKNFSPEFYFQSTITIANPFSKPTSTPATKVATPYELQLFPEGGQWVQGLESKVAFRAVGEDGKGVAFRGRIVNQQNDTLVRFEPYKFGIGSFVFTPQAGQSYRVLLQNTENKWFTYAPPAILEQGYVVQVNESTANTLEIVVRAQGKEGAISLLAHTKGVGKYAAQTSLQNGQARFTINKNLLGDGTTTLTIFDNKQQPVCERLYFKRPKESLNIAAKITKPLYNTREKVELDLGTQVGTAKTAADLSISVFLVDSLPAPAPVLIDSYLGLSSDLKGTVESPHYYFQNEDDVALDHLMLTHGWRRFTWNDVTQTKPKFAFAPEMTGHFISGKVLDAKTGTPVSNIDTYLAAPSKRPQLFASTSDSLGRILFELKHFLGSKEVIVQTNTRKDSTYRIEINSPYSDKTSSYSLPPFRFDASWKNDLLTRSINMQTRNSFLPKSAQQMNTTEADTLAFFGIPDEKYLLDAYTRFPTLEEVMREYVPGVAVRRRQGKFIFRVYDKLQANVPFEEEPLVMIDGVPMFDTDKVLTFDPLKIKALQVIDGLYYLGPVSFPGIVSYTTYKGDLAGFPIDPRALVLSYEGVQGKREFYAPRYDSAAQLKSRVPDFRNHLYWNPQVVTSTDSKQTLNFYTSDQAGTYRVVVQGITDKGVAGSKMVTFEVKKSSL